MAPASKPRLLVVDDEPGLRDMLAIMFRREGLEVTLAPGYKTGCDAVTHAPEPYAVVLTDLMMPDGSGLDLLSHVKKRTARTEVIMMTAHGGLDTAIDAMKRGAYDFVSKPFAANELRALVQKALEKRDIVTENETLLARLGREQGREVIFRSEGMRRVFELTQSIARARTTVLITGESGTGKERIARAIHEASDRRDKPFLVLQERKVRGVGATAEVPIDVRVLAATNRNVEDDVKSGRFRQDLYYRLNVIRVDVPPLRGRRDDIRPL